LTRPKRFRFAEKKTSVGHNILLSHGHIVRLYREEFQKKQSGKISIALVRLRTAGI
jgi:hypothetical protein